MTLTWYIAGTMAAVAIGWLAAMLHAAGYAPVVLISVATGAVLGAALAYFARRLLVSCRARLVVGAIVLAMLTVAAEHAWLYRDFRQQWHEARSQSPQVAIFRPEVPWSPREYLARELTPARAALWFFDAALIATTAAAMIILVPRLLPPPEP